jgi:hypothetical protein
MKLQQEKSKRGFLKVGPELESKFKNEKGNLTDEFAG